MDWKGEPFLRFFLFLKNRATNSAHLASLFCLSEKKPCVVGQSGILINEVFFFLGQGAIETLILTYFILLKFLYQVDMKTVVKCPLEFLCYSPTWMTYSEGLIKSSSHENYLLLKILDQWNKFPILVLTFLYGSIFETLHFLKICPILSSSYGSQCKSNQGRASEMDWTLHTDLWESGTSRDIKK